MLNKRIFNKFLRIYRITEEKYVKWKKYFLCSLMEDPSLSTLHHKHILKQARRTFPSIGKDQLSVGILVEKLARMHGKIIKSEGSSHRFCFVLKNVFLGRLSITDCSRFLRPHGDTTFCIIPRTNTYTHRRKTLMMVLSTSLECTQKILQEYVLVESYSLYTEVWETLWNTGVSLPR